MSGTKILLMTLFVGVLALSFSYVFPALAEPTDDATPAVAPRVPEPIQQGDVTFLSGGVSVDERQSMESQEKNYNLLITNANKQGQMSLQSSVVITGKGGREILNVDNGGPLFYVKLPPGRYSITATNGAQKEKRNVTISSRGVRRLSFTWQEE